MDGIKRCQEIWIESQRIVLEEFKRVSWLRINVDANDFEARSVISNPCPTSTREEIK